MTEITFESLNIGPDILKALAKLNYVSPSAIQAQAIPFLVEGRDVIGQAQTGTGKTAAFAIPILEKVDTSLPEIQAVVVCPTRELALQVADEFRKFGKYKPNLSIVCVFGGEPIERQQLALQNLPQIIIGTPGRMLDFLWRGTFHLNSLKTVVLDEADEMLNMGFRDDIEKIFDFLPSPRQTVFFSATMPPAIMALTKLYQDNPEWVRIEPEPVSVAQISQTYVEVFQKQKPQALIQLIQQYDLKLALVFCNTKHQVDSLVQALHKAGIAVDGLHGGKLQNIRERILSKFRKGQIEILVATDVAARGIDVRNVQAVINYDLPLDEESYTHRIGRTGRAGQTGQAFSLVAGHQFKMLKQLQRQHTIVKETLPGIQGGPPPAGKPTDKAPVKLHKPRRRRKPKPSQQAL